MNAGTAATITNLTSPTNSGDAATKGYVDTSISNLVASAPGALDTLNELAAALGNDASFSTTVTNSIAAKLPLAGGTMSGAIAMGTSKITGLGTPTANTDAATKGYVDTSAAAGLPTTGGTMTGNIVMGSNKVTSTATPTTNDDLTRKAYVDSILGSATAAATSASNAATSETNAGNSASAASSSASAASASASSAAASYDSFDDRYLGPKSSAPTVDNDGNTLLTGALYWNTTSSNLFIWTGSAWTSAAFTAGGFLVNSNNLSDVSSTSTARTNLGLAIGTNVQAYNANTAVTNAAQTFTATQTFSGSSSATAIVLNDAAELVTVSATAATGTINYDITTQAVLYYTSDASANWTVNFRGSSGTSLNTLMTTGQSMTAVFLVTQGSTAYYNSALTIDGTSVTPKYQGGTAPTAGNASAIDAYSYTIIKTGSATFTVLASITKFA
jgi:hypothetical protein